MPYGVHFKCSKSLPSTLAWWKIADKDVKKSVDSVVFEWMAIFEEFCEHASCDSMNWTRSRTMYILFWYYGSLFFIPCNFNTLIYHKNNLNYQYLTSSIKLRGLLDESHHKMLNLGHYYNYYVNYPTNSIGIVSWVYMECRIWDTPTSNPIVHLHMVLYSTVIY